MVKIRQVHKGKCDSCGEEDAGFTYQLGWGNAKMMKVSTLCDKCMHELLTKMIVIGGKQR